MKKINTLVEDIYSLFSLDPIDMKEEEVDKHIDTFGEMLKLHIKEFMYEKPRKRGNLRLSAIGKPVQELSSYMVIYWKSFYFYVPQLEVIR